MSKAEGQGVSASTVALAQIVIFGGTMAGFIGLLYVLLLGGAQLDGTSEKLTYTMLGVLGTIVGTMTAYFYSRQRPETPLPGETTVTTTPTTTTTTTATPGVSSLANRTAETINVSTDAPTGGT